MKTEVAQSIIAITEAFLPVATENKVLCISIDARASDFGSKKKEVSSVRGIHIAIYRPSNYTKVIMAVDSKVAFSFDKNAKFKYKSDHDSCWRSDGLESPLFKVSCEMVDELVSKGAKQKPFASYSWFVYISSVKIVDGSIKIDRNDDYKVSLILN